MGWFLMHKPLAEDFDLLLIPDSDSGTATCLRKFAVILLPIRIKEM
jgi:hypothetical protein